MTQFAFLTGLSGLLADTREFVLAIRFARVELLVVVLVIPVLTLANHYAARRRRSALAAIGRPAAVSGQLTHPRFRQSWLGLAYPLAWLMLAIGIAGPRWGTRGESGVAVGRDLVVVIDLSRSMLADDTAATDRWMCAKAGVLDLLAGASQRGGHRIAIIVFAARPKVLVPLTTDYDHVRAVVEEIDGRFPPPECRPGGDPNIASGTRIGTALIAALQTHDARFPGSQDVLLLSDGDDPADDAEWLRGTTAARTANIPVHVVGIGNPAAPSVVSVGDPLEPDLVSTQLQEAPLKQIAAETRGVYLPSHQEVPRLGEFFRTRIEPFPSRTVSDDAVPQPKDRTAWFLLPSLMLFTLGWLRGR